MIQVVELTGYVNEKGCIEVPVKMFEKTGIHTEEEVKLIYLSVGDREYAGKSREFILVKSSKDMPGEMAEEESFSLKLPPELLMDAGISPDADLDIVCMERKIMIVPTDDMEEVMIPKELAELCAELGISEDKISILLKDMEEEVQDHTAERFLV